MRSNWLSRFLRSFSPCPCNPAANLRKGGASSLPILFPGIFLAATVLAVNIMGDGLRDSLDPRLRKHL